MILRLWILALILATPQLTTAKEKSIPHPLDSSVPKSRVKSLEAASGRLLAFEDCDFLVQLYHPKDKSVSPLGFCIYQVQVMQGIFPHDFCVGVLVEPESATRHAFYGKDGHWGANGKCVGKTLIEKMKEPMVDKTVNPITSIRQKRKEGNLIRLLRDKYGLWKTFQARTKPAK